MELAVQPTCSLIHVNASTCLIDFYPASMVSSCLIYKLEKITDQRFRMKLSPSSPSGHSELNPPPILLEFQTALPPVLLEFQSKKFHSPSVFENAAPGMVWIFSAIAQLSGLTSLSSLIFSTCLAKTELWVAAKSSYL